MAEVGHEAKFFHYSSADELRAELHGDKKGKGHARKKAALKRTIANATMGNDMSDLFDDVVSLMGVQVLDIKRLIYLYLVNYAQSNPQRLPQCIPGFLADARDPNPVIRALALRTMSYIPSPSVSAAIVEPLRRALRDPDPFVRKTAAVCVAKLQMNDPGVVEKYAFMDALRDLLVDGHPNVVANAVAALYELSERDASIQLRINYKIATKVVAVLDQCSEWGQTYILELLLFFVPQTHEEAEQIAERVSVRLQQTNPTVILTAVKVVMYLQNYIASAAFRDMLCRKMSPALVMMLNTPPEIQYVALRNILLIIQRRPAVLAKEITAFFCKYNDPIYLKTAKLEIVRRLVDEDTAPQVLPELQEYASEIDVNFARMAINTIGHLALRLEGAAESCVAALTEIVRTRVHYAVQEAIVVVCGILRRYPRRYEGMIDVLLENLDSVDEPQAKAAMIWILGQYADRIENSADLLDDFLCTFLEEPAEVQLALLTATVKLFLRRPSAGSALVPKVLRWATEEVSDPDCRDRGFLYWRMLSADTELAKKVIRADLPAVNLHWDRLDRQLLDQLLLHANSIASVYHQQPDTFLESAKARYMPESPALDAAARPYASAHLHIVPSLRGAGRPPGALSRIPSGAHGREPDALWATREGAAGIPRPESTSFMSENDSDMSSMLADTLARVHISGDADHGAGGIGVLI
ncbi:hypothetical protein MSPP1_001057 [Malassezia sp. CBS 17886]|nr:hypothetical protein MSPP1_001057 [Malassezia sp. CBS 17886]